MSIQTQISVGEFLDKLTILQIKSEKIADADKRANVETERNTLESIWQKSAYAQANIDELFGQLKAINLRLWEIEDEIRIKEAAKQFDNHFIALARSVYVTNDERARIKKQINETLGSDLIEEKSYEPY